MQILPFQITENIFFHPKNLEKNDFEKKENREGMPMSNRGIFECVMTMNLKVKSRFKESHLRILRLIHQEIFARVQ